MRTADFNYPLPPALIAQAPLPQRDQSRLLVLHRGDGRIEHRRFRDLPEYLRPGDLVVLNNSRVIPARLRGRNPRGGGQVELLLLEENRPNDWWCLARPARRLRVNSTIVLAAGGRTTGITATVRERNAEGHCRIQFAGVADLAAQLDQLGEVPLPPYIRRRGDAPAVDDRLRYQTVFAAAAGSVAAPTAGLHFTRRSLADLRRRGVRIGFVTLHVGWATFAPVRVREVEDHVMHEERFVLDAPAARMITETHRAGGRVLAVGTSTVRVLETVAAARQDALVETRARTRLFINPPFSFRVADALLTNFHLPESTLLMLVCAFAAPGRTGGRERVLAAYAEAVRERYRFYSYGDAMLLW